MSDAVIRARGAIAVPDYPSTPFTVPKPLSEACVAVCTTAAFHPPGVEPLGRGDTRFTVLDHAERSLVLGHASMNFDRIASSVDLNVVYPLDRLDELVQDGTIGSVSPIHLSFVGNQTDDTLDTIRLDSGPAAAKVLRDAGVDVVLLTPV